METRLLHAAAAAAALALDPVALSDDTIEAVRRAHVFAPARTPVVLVGETGTGKTTLARYIHQFSGRPDGFHALSVGSLEPQLAKDDLFGHVEGAFTDGRRARPGLIASAGAGTLLLDDFQNLATDVQKKLFQVLDEGRFLPVGLDRPVDVRCRFLLAMSEYPDELVRRGVLNKDIRYRLRLCEIRLPTLEQRRAEIPVLVQRFIAACPEWTGLDGPNGLSTEALAVLTGARYPGNLRELAGIVERAFLEARASGRDRIEVWHLPPELRPHARYVPWGDPDANRRAVEHAMAACDGSVAAAARLLHTSRSTIYGALRDARRRVSNLSSSA